MAVILTCYSILKTCLHLKEANKLKKGIAASSLLVLSILTLPLNVHSKVKNKEIDSHILKSESAQAKKKPATIGHVTNYIQKKEGEWITVNGYGNTPTDKNEIILSITNKTKIMDVRGRKVSLKTIVGAKKTIKVFYGEPITLSLPAQAKALKIVVQDYDFTAINGTILEVTENSILVNGQNIYTKQEETILLHLDPKAQLSNQNGQSVKAVDLTIGMTIQAYYGPVTNSTPPLPQQTTLL